MDEAIRVLYVGGGPDYESRAARLEGAAPEFAVTAVADGSDALDVLSEESVDCVVSEYDLGDIDGLGLLNLVRDTDPAIPFVLCAADGSERVASDAISAGVSDYVPMHDADGGFDAAELADAVRAEAERYRAEQDVAMLNDLARNVYERVTDAFFALNRDWEFTYLNEEAERILEVRAEDVIGENVWEAFPAAVGSTFYTEYHRAIATQEAVTFDEYFEPLDRHFEVRAFPSEDGLSVHFRTVSEGAQSARGTHLMELTNMLSYDLVDSIERAREAVDRARETGDPEDLEEVAAALDRMDDLVSHSMTLASEEPPRSGR